MSQYIGSHEIKEVKELDLKTPLGEPIYEVSFLPAKTEDGKEYTPETDLMPKKLFDLVVTEELSDLTAVRDKQIKEMTRQILTIMAEWGLRYNDWEYLVSFLQASNQDAVDTATKQLYGVSNYKRNLLHTHKVLSSAESNGGSSDNSGDSTSPQE